MRGWFWFLAAVLIPIGLAVVSPRAAEHAVRSCSSLTGPQVPSGSFCPATAGR